MLIDNKFIFINIPRCASTSFHISCINSSFDIQYSSLDDMFKIVKRFNETDHIHVHETIDQLIEKFGDNYPIISIKRDKYERFLSMWKHCISETKRYGEIDLAVLFTKLDINDILWYDSENVGTAKDRHELITLFLSRYGFNLKEIDPRVATILNTLIIPTYFYHKNNQNIIWFDFNKLDEIQIWVKKVTNKDFKLKNLNSSKDVQVNIKIDDEFKKAYDRIYGIFDNRKEHKTII